MATPVDGRGAASWHVAAALERAGAIAADGRRRPRARWCWPKRRPRLARPEPGRAVRDAPAQRPGRRRARSPAVSRSKGAVAIVDAGEGLAFPACELAVAEAIATRARIRHRVRRCRPTATTAASIVDHLRPLADAGMVGLGFTNSPAAMPAAGGRHPIFGTNPVAALFPRRGARAVDDRPEPERSRARQVDGRGEGRPARSRPAGRSMPTASRPPTRRPAWPDRCCRSARCRARRARCSRSSSSCSSPR